SIVGYICISGGHATTALCRRQPRQKVAVPRCSRVSGDGDANISAASMALSTSHFKGNHHRGTPRVGRSLQLGRMLTVGVSEGICAPSRQSKRWRGGGRRILWRRGGR